MGHVDSKPLTISDDSVGVNVSNTRIASLSKCEGNSYDSVVLWEAATGQTLWLKKLKPSKTRAVPPSFSVDGHYLACFNGPNVVYIMRTLGTIVDPLPTTVPVPVDSTVVAIALYNEQMVAVVSVCNYPRSNFASIELTRTTNQIDTVIMSVSLASHVNGKPVEMVQGTYTADGVHLFIVVHVHDEQHVRIITYDVNSKAQLVTVTATTEKDLTCCRVFGTIRVGDKECVVLGMSSKHQPPRRLRLRRQDECASKEKVLVIAPRGDITTVLDASGLHQCHRVTVLQGKLVYLQRDARRSMMCVQEWNAATNTFFLRGEIEGGDQWSEHESLVGVAVSADTVTWMTRDGQVHFCKINKL